MAGWIYGCTDRQTENLPILQDFVRPSVLPLEGPRASQAGLRPSQLGLRARQASEPLRPGWLALRTAWLALKPAWLALRPAWLALRPAWLALRPDRDELTDGQTDRWMENLPILQDFVPY